MKMHYNGMDRRKGFEKLKNDGTYRVGTEFYNQDGISYSAGVAFPIANELRIDFPQIKEVASIYQKGGQIAIGESEI